MQMISKATIIMSQEGHKKDKFHLKLRNAEDIIGSQNQVLSGTSSSPPSGDERKHVVRRNCTTAGLHAHGD